MAYALYALALLLSSSLVFIVQPMAAKMLQPILGGAPAVWNTSMVFFQALLLGGYLYAHLSTKWLGVRRQALLHLFVLAMGLLFLPIAFSAPEDPASIASPALWLLLALLFAMGWPFFVITSTAPLLQKWFSALDHPRAADPYHLYAASNVGSFTALLAYPFLIEPRLGLQFQSLLWTVGYLLLIAAIAGCAAILWKNPRLSVFSAPRKAPPPIEPIKWSRRFRWILWAFLPSALLLAVTAFITTDLAPVPLLWIPPLAIYLLSFVLVFARRQWIPHRVWAALMPAALLSIFTLFVIDRSPPLILEVLLHLGAFFIFSMYFHGRLARDRPTPESLTDFYLYLSLGGVLGGIFTALAAPLLFDLLLEYPLLLSAAALSTSSLLASERPFRYFGSIAALIIVALLIFEYFPGADQPLSIFFWLPPLLLVLFLAISEYRPSRLPLFLAILGLAVGFSLYLPEPEELDRRRSFFGAHQVRTDSSGYFHLLYHGNTNHGVQSRLPEFEALPLAYYYPTGPLDEIFELIHRRENPRPAAVVGLGTGSMAAYSQNSLPIDFFEIDRAVIEIASNPALFTYLRDCGRLCRIIVGDGRLQLSAMEDESYDLIVLDAYTSAAIPVHLLTREALELYLQKLRPEGLLAIHISNRYLDLEPPLTRAAHELDLASRFRYDLVDEAHPYYNYYAHPSTWMVMTRKADHLREIAIDPAWEDLPPREEIRIWTDDFADLLGVFLF